MKPFLNWAGGKRWLVNDYPDHIPTNTARHIEPFVGSGAVFFYCSPQTALIADSNANLVEAYQAIKDNPKAVHNHLKIHDAKHCRDYYYLIRSQEYDDPFERAARFIYLNRTCFYGLYRVNKNGGFNVPIGTKKHVLQNDDSFSDWSEALCNAEIVAQDFEKTIDSAKKGEFIYADPPYTVQHNNNGFVKYNETMFSWEDQKRLSVLLKRAAERGVKILASNADHPSIWELYSSEIWSIQRVDRFSGIASSSTRRKIISEILISNSK